MVSIYFRYFLDLNPFWQNHVFAIAKTHQSPNLYLFNFRTASLQANCQQLWFLSWADVSKCRAWGYEIYSSNVSSQGYRGPVSFPRAEFYYRVYCSFQGLHLTPTRWVQLCMYPIIVLGIWIKQVRLLPNLLWSKGSCYFAEVNQATLAWSLRQWFPSILDTFK